MTPQEVVYFASPAAFRRWLKTNHAKATELWVGFYKKATGKQTFSWEQAVDEALCYGWIDGIRKSVDDERYTNRFTPRKRSSNWSLINVSRVEQLIAEGRMQPAGLAAYEARDSARSGVYSFEQRASAALTPEEEKHFRRWSDAWAFWEAQPPGYKRVVLHWIVSAKRAETRERRLVTLIGDCASGRRIGPMRRPE